MATLTPSPKMQFLDANGNPLAGGKLYTYASGTTTPLASYTDATGGTPNTNPVILDSAGYASVWLGTSLYTLKLTTSADVLVWTADGVGGVATLSALAASGGSALVGYTQGGTGAVARTVQTKLREEISVNDFGAVGDGVTNDLTAIANAIAAVADGGTLIFPQKKNFFIGDIVNNNSAFTITKDIIINGGESTFTCTASGTGTDASLFNFVDCVANVCGVKLDQTNFSIGGAQRGVNLYRINSAAASTSGHILKGHVIRGQSPLTAVSSTPASFRASDIQVNLTAATCLYGINLASNGDRVRGSVFANSYSRLFYGYDINDVDIDVHGGLLPNATSGAINIHTRKVLPTQNIKIRAVFDVLDGPIIIDDLTTDAGTGYFRNIDLDVRVASYSAAMTTSIVSNGVFRVGSFDALGNWETVASQTTEVEAKFRLSAPASFTYPTGYIYTPSTGRRTIELYSEHPQIFGADKLTWFKVNNSGLIRKALNSATINIPLSNISGITINQIYILDILLTVRENTAFAGQNTTVERWEVHGYTTGGGVLNIQAYNRAWVSKTGAKTITTTMAATGTDDQFVITASGYTLSASHVLQAEVKPSIIT